MIIQLNNLNILTELIRFGKIKKWKKNPSKICNWTEVREMEITNVLLVKIG